MSASSLEGVLNGFAISFPRSFPSWWYGAHHWSSCSGPSVSWCMWYDLGGTLQAWPQHPWVLQGAHGCWHHVSCPVGFSQGRQKLSPWSLSVPLCCLQAPIAHASPGIWFPGLQRCIWGGPCCPVGCSFEEEPVLQGTLKYGEGVVGIFGVPVIGRQADGCHPSCQCTSNGISCGLGRLSKQLLWSQFWGVSQVLDGLIMVSSEKPGGGYKNGCILGTIGPIYFKLGQDVAKGVPYH